MRDTKRDSARGRTTRRALILAVVLFAAPVVPASATHTCGLPTASLVADWAGLFDANDTLGCHDGTLVGGTAFQLGGRDVSFSFDGVDDSVSVPDAPVWDFGTADFRIELAGVVFREDCGADLLHPGCIFVGHDNGPSTQNKWVFEAAAGQLGVVLDGSVPRTVITAPFGPALGVPYDLTLARAGGVFQFFVNGTLAGATSSSLSLPDAGVPLTIGQAEGIGYFNGLIDNIRITRS